MNLSVCALGPSVGPSHVATCEVDAPISALAAANASAPACAVITGAATVVGSAAAEALSTCIRPPTPSTVPAVKPARLKKLLRVAMLYLLSSIAVVPTFTCAVFCSASLRKIAPTQIRVHPLFRDLVLIPAPRAHAAGGARHKRPNLRPRS